MRTALSISIALLVIFTIAWAIIGTYNSLPIKTISPYYLNIPIAAIFFGSLISTVIFAVRRNK